MNRQYEGIIFINPSVTQEEMNTIISKIKNILADLKGNFIEEKQPEKVKLPYKMKKCKEGFYYYIKFEISSDLVANFRDRIKLIEGIIRIMISLIVIKKVKIKDKKAQPVESVESINENIKETEKSEQSNSETTNNEEALK